MLPLNRGTRAAVLCGLARRAAAGRAAAHASRARALGARVQPDASCVWLDACTCMHGRAALQMARWVCAAAVRCVILARTCVCHRRLPAGVDRVGSICEAVRVHARRPCENKLNGGCRRASSACHLPLGLAGGLGDHGLSMRPRPPSSRGLFGG